MTDKEALVQFEKRCIHCHNGYEDTLNLGEPPCDCCSWALAISALRDRIAGGWISVKDKLPEELEEVLVTSGDMFSVTDYCTDYEGNPSWGYTGFGDCEVTHWQRLLAPPSEKGEEL